jgi:hypothetical protein
MEMRLSLLLLLLMQQKLSLPIWPGKRTYEHPKPVAMVSYIPEMSSLTITWPFLIAGAGDFRN